jgi:cytochrome c5
MNNKSRYGFIISIAALGQAVDPYADITMEVEVKAPNSAADVAPRKTPAGRRILRSACEACSAGRGRERILLAILG